VAYYEWWCPRCRVTHPPGRKVCVHCGGRVQESRDGGPRVFDVRSVLETRLGVPSPAGQEPAGAGPSSSGAEPDDVPEPRGARGARIGMTVAWVLLAVVATLLRMCQERG
jgi:hypothetical protein